MLFRSLHPAELRSIAGVIRGILSPRIALIDADQTQPASAGLISFHDCGALVATGPDAVAILPFKPAGVDYTFSPMNLEARLP